MEGGCRKGRTEAQMQRARTSSMHGTGYEVTARVRKLGRASLHGKTRVDIVVANSGLRWWAGSS